MAVGNVDQLVDLLLEDLVVVISRTRPEVSVVVDNFLGNERSTKVTQIEMIKPTSHHPNKVCTLRIFAFAVFSSKFASSRPSPASAKLSLVASAPNFSMASRNVNEFPVLFDIFFPFNIKCPFVRMLRGHLSSGNSAAWLYSAKVRWLGTRSFAEERMSNG